MKNNILFLIFMCWCMLLTYKLEKNNYIDRLKESTKNFNENSKNYWIVFILISILCYGFTLTNYSIGIDDEAFSIYYHGNGLLEQGRIGSYFLSSIFDSYYFLPFWRDFIAIILIMISITVWGYYFWTRSEGGITLTQRIIFASCVISCPIIAEYFIFMSATIEIGLYWMLTGGALIAIYEGLLDKKDKWLTLVGIILLVLAVSFSEASAPMFLAGAFMGMYIKFYYMQESEKYNLRMLLNETLMIIGSVSVAIILKSIFTKFILSFLEIPQSGYVSNYIKWDFNNIKDSLTSFIINFKNTIVYQYDEFLHIKIFIMCTIILLVISIYLAIKYKRYIYCIIWGAITISTISLIVLTGNPNMPQRTMIIYSIYIGFTCMCVIELIRNVNIKLLATIGIGIMVLNQSRELNINFYNDYKRYLLDLNTIKNISREVEIETGDIIPVKPVVFIGLLEDSYNIYRGEVIGQSLLRWDRMWGQDSADRIYNFYNMFGYNYKRVATEQIEKAKLDAVGMECWPQQGSVKEFDEYIIVKMGDLSLEKYEMNKDDFDKYINRNSVNIDGWINHVSINNNLFNINGWAIYKDFDSTNTKIRVAFIGDENQYLVETQPMGGVTDHFNNGINYDNAGFNLSNYNVSILEPGKYKVGIVLETSKLSTYFDINYELEVKDDQGERDEK